MSLLNEDSMSQWLTYAMSQKQDLNLDMAEFKIYPVKTDCCLNPRIMTTDDGNRWQKCLSCGWSFKAAD